MENDKKQAATDRSPQTLVDFLQVLARITFRATVTTLLLIQLDKRYIWAIPYGVLIGIMSEARSLTKV